MSEHLLSVQRSKRATRTSEPENVNERVNMCWRANIRSGSPVSATQLMAVLGNCRLRIPRRPEWTHETTPEQLDDMERIMFLEWRRELAM